MDFSSKLVIESLIHYPHIYDIRNRRVPCILITSCGYPDVATRAMVARLLQMYPVSPVCIALL